MYNMVSVNKFDKSLVNCESLDLSFKLFENLDYSVNEHIVSFYRCDFRRSKFNNCIFYKNPFGRADFIDTYIYNSKFVEVNWGSCLFENATFENVEFYKNQYKGVSIRYSYFRNCTLTKENIITNMYDCIFENCTFVDCLYEKSSITNVMFVNCKFVHTDLSQCHAEKLKFDSCKLEEVFLGLPFWGTYLFRETFINGFAFKYRGEVVDIIREEYFLKSFAEFWEKGRLFEFLNAHIISKQLSICSDLVTITQKIFEELKTFQPKIRRKNILDILDMLEFYFNYRNIDFITYHAIIEYICDYGWRDYPFNETIEYSSKIFKIRAMMSNFLYDYQYLYTIDPKQKCECTFRINYETQEEALAYIAAIFESANKNLCDNFYNSPLFKVTCVASGSIVLTISSWALLAVLVSYCVKRVFHNIEAIKIEHVFSTAIQKCISNSDEKYAISEIDKAGKLATKYQLLNTANVDDDKINKVSAEITKGEIISIILNWIS